MLRWPPGMVNASEPGAVGGPVIAAA